MISEDFINAIPKDLTKGALYIISEFYVTFEKTSNSDDLEFHHLFIDYYNLLDAFLDAYHFPFERVQLSKNKQQNIESIYTFFLDIRKGIDEKAAIEDIDSSKKRFDGIFNKQFQYEFSQSDLERIQELLNELRDSISESELYTDEHKQRILKRLERLQSELHKKVSDLDKFWGLISDAGIALGKFGKNAKPFVDRIREITEIVWRTQARAENLSEDNKLPNLNDPKELKPKGD